MHGLHTVYVKYQSEAHYIEMCKWLDELGYSKDYEVTGWLYDDRGYAICPVGGVWKFECSNEAMHFKLQWGGAKHAPSG